MFVLSELSNGVGNQGIFLDFVWNILLLVEGYVLQLVMDFGFVNVVFIVDELSVIMFFVFNLEVEIIYYWWVRGDNICGVGVWFMVYFFIMVVE